jgi:putative oxidoreductase
MTQSDLSGYGTTLLRVAMGAFFLPHALVKLLVFAPDGTAAFFSSVGLPGALAWPIILLELIGEVALIVGVASRIFALLLAADLLGAIVTVHMHSGYFFNDPQGGWEYLAMWIVGLLAVALQGDGRYALGARFGLRAGAVARAA